MLVNVDTCRGSVHDEKNVTDQTFAWAGHWAMHGQGTWQSPAAPLSRARAAWHHLAHPTGAPQDLCRPSCPSCSANVNGNSHNSSLSTSFRWKRSFPSSSFLAWTGAFCLNIKFLSGSCRNLVHCKLIYILPAFPYQAPAYAKQWVYFLSHLPMGLWIVIRVSQTRCRCPRCFPSCQSAAGSITHTQSIYNCLLGICGV